VEVLMLVGPLLVVGSLVFLYFFLGGKVPTEAPPAVVWLPLVALAAWIISLRVLPEKQCYVCKERGSVGWGLTRRVCPRCGGSGRIRRVGSKRG
jgi:hypothetical protein